jgi:hypothetical protein
MVDGSAISLCESSPRTYGWDRFVMKISLNRFVAVAGIALLAGFHASLVSGQVTEQTPAPGPQTAERGLNEPVYRISKNQPVQPAAPVPHSLDPALAIAHQGLAISQGSINDYTAKLVKRERIEDTLGEHEYMFIKIRNRKQSNGQIVVPFSVYVAFLKPAAVKGREVVFVENQNQGKFLVHEGGMKRMLGTHALEPTGWLAMQGQRYPVTEIGLENLVAKLIERGERDKRHGECSVQFLEGAKVSGRACTVIQVEHPDKVGPYDFHIAQVFLDNEYRIPVRYAAYTWPKAPGQQPEVLEEYTYQDIKFNVGLTDADFDANNPEYGFHKK